METASFAIYLAALACTWIAAGLLSVRRDRSARAALVAALTLLAATAAVRWWHTGHPPIFGTHENAIASASALLIAALWIMRPAVHGRESRAAGLVSAIAGITLAYGSFFERGFFPLTISERSLWVDVHVLFAWSAYAGLVTAGCVAIAVLARTAPDDAGTDSRQMVRLGVGFASFTAMLAVGSFYTFQLFSDWFMWEIVESLAVAAWLALGLVIHGRLFWRWSGRRLAVAAVMLLPLVIATYWVWSVYPGTYHYFDIPAITAGGL